MGWRHFIGLALGAILLAGCSRSTDDSSSSSAASSASSMDLGETISLPGLLSYRAPKGWSTDTETNASPQPRGPPSTGFTPDITFNAGNHGSLADFVASYQPELYDTSLIPLKFVDQKPFVTAAGVKGVRLRSVDPSNPSRATQFSYIFLSSDGQQLELACACATADVSRYEPIFEASMKSVVISAGD